jgi:predicted DNA binding CopG/RHH family protein
MRIKHKDTTFLIRISAQLLAQAQERAALQGVPLSQIITAALQDYVRYGTTRPPPDNPEDDAPSVF